MVFSHLRSSYLWSGSDHSTLVPKIRISCWLEIDYGNHSRIKINLIISPHHISDNCDPPLNAAMAIRIRVGVVEAYTECHDATLRNAFFLHLHKIYDICVIYFVKMKEKSIVLCGIMTFRVSLAPPPP